MKNIRLSLVAAIIFSVILTISCGNKKEKTRTTTQAKSQDVDRSKDAEKIIGIWKLIERDGWFELKADGTYDMGKKGEMEKTGQNWELDFNKAELTLNDPDKPRVLNYKLRGDELILNRKGGKKAFTAVRVEERP
jgi:hypothetical protein